jgi:hypothetical protein
MRWVHGTTFNKQRQCWDIFKKRIETLTERYVPKKKRHAGGRPVWMSQQLLRSIGQKRRLWKAQQGQPSQEYRDTEKKVKKMIRNAKGAMEKKLAYENGGNSKPFYAYLKSRINCRVPVGPLKDEKGDLVIEMDQMAELLNKYFSSVFTDEDVNTIPEVEEKTGMRPEDIQISESKIKDKIKEIKPASAPGPDSIGTMLLQQLNEQVAPALTIIFRKVLDEGQVPDDWKRANVTPIFKKGSKADPHC